jgi:glycosyltransferase involved in cell wall biosynthesis
MTAPLITVLITTYNYGRFIEEAIESVLGQNFPSEMVQILVVDDGSTDDTRVRLKNYGSRVEYLYKKNGGQATALNFGFERACGEIIALLDGDDLFLPGRLSRIAEAFGLDPELGLVYHRARVWHMETDAYGEWEFAAISGDIRKQPDLALLYFPQPTSCLAFRRTCLNPILPIPENIVMLADCFPAALIPFLSPILAIPECLSVYRIHGKNAYYADQQQMPPEMRKTRLSMWKIVIPAMFQWLAANGFSRKQEQARIFFDRWTLFEERDRFLFEPPGRLEHFRHLMRYRSCYRGQMNWRLQVVSYLNALGSLFTGYKHFPLLDSWRLKLTGGAGS